MDFEKVDKDLLVEHSKLVLSLEFVQAQLNSIKQKIAQQLNASRGNDKQPVEK